MTRRLITNEMRQRVIDAVGEGKTLREIAVEMGMSRSTVSEIVKQGAVFPEYKKLRLDYRSEEWYGIVRLRAKAFSRAVNHGREPREELRLELGPEEMPGYGEAQVALKERLLLSTGSHLPKMGRAAESVRVYNNTGQEMLRGLVER